MCTERYVKLVNYAAYTLSDECINKRANSHRIIPLPPQLVARASDFCTSEASWPVAMAWRRGAAVAVLLGPLLALLGYLLMVRPMRSGVANIPFPITRKVLESDCKRARLPERACGALGQFMIASWTELGPGVKRQIWTHLDMERDKGCLSCLLAENLVSAHIGIRKYESVLVELEILLSEVARSIAASKTRPRKRGKQLLASLHVHASTLHWLKPSETQLAAPPGNGTAHALYSLAYDPTECLTWPCSCYLRPPAPEFHAPETFEAARLPRLAKARLSRFARSLVDRFPGLFLAETKAAASGSDTDVEKSDPQVSPSLQTVIKRVRELECSPLFVRARLEEWLGVMESAQRKRFEADAGHETVDEYETVGTDETVASGVGEGELDEYSSENYSWGTMFYHGFLQMLSGHPRVLSAVAMARQTGDALIVMGSNTGNEVFYAALGLGVRARGYEIVCPLVRAAQDITRDVVTSAQDRKRIRFECADALRADVSDARVVYLDDDSWDFELVSAMFAKLERELPHGAVVLGWHGPFPDSVVAPSPTGRTLGFVGYTQTTSTWTETHAWLSEACEIKSGKKRKKVPFYCALTRELVARPGVRVYAQDLNAGR